MRKRLSYANVTATLALVFAMSGGAMAANHYLITSTKQINPKVLKKLNGQAGQDRSRRCDWRGRSDRRTWAGRATKKDQPGNEGKAGRSGPSKEHPAATACLRAYVEGSQDR